MQRPQRATGSRPRLRSVSVQDELKQRIDRGELPAGTRLPSEPELAAELQVSRATLREALRAMELEGLLRRRQGSGTFVAEHPRMANSLDVNYGVTDAIRAAGMTAGIADGRHWVEPASAGEAALLELEPGQDVLVIERLRTAEGKPVVLSRDLFPSRLVEGRELVVQQMLERSIYDVLERELGIVISHGVARFRPVRADHAVAGRLGVPRGELLLYLWQVDYAQDGVPVVSSHEFHLADAFDFTVVRRGPGRRLT
ncbi:MAG TPA: GntR family transcriptional regulator [Actinomycetota bacterium]|nr:GntR family transcriptional regulator [Actinomycetota bacterium]